MFLGEARIYNFTLYQMTTSRPIFFLRIDDSHCNRIHSSITTVHCFAILMWESNQKNIVQCTGIELQESMGRYIFRRNVTEVMLKIMLKPIQSINQSNNKTLHQFKLKEFPDDTLMVTQDLKFILGRIENIGSEDPGYQHFLLFPQCFQKHSSVGDMGLFDKGLSCNLM